MLILTMIFAVILIIGIIIVFLVDADDMLGWVLRLIGLVMLIIMAIFWPLIYNDSVIDYKKYEVIKQTIEKSRTEEISEIERAALTTKVIEINETLSEYRYWNGTIFKDAVYNKIAEAEYLK